jgi:hypothetical protein
MARLFNDLLNKKEPEPAPHAGEDQHKSNELKTIYKEIKMLRKYQFELNEKFNYIYTRLTNNGSKAPKTHANTVKKSNKPQQTAKLNKPSTITSGSPSSLLTGAKKRKFNSSKFSNNQSRSNTSTPTSSNSSPASSLVSTSRSESKNALEFDNNTNDGEEEGNEEDEEEEEEEGIDFEDNDECLIIKEEDRQMDDLEMDEEQENGDNDENSNNPVSKEHSLTDLVESYSNFRNTANKHQLVFFFYFDNF